MCCQLAAKFTPSTAQFYNIGCTMEVIVIMLTPPRNTFLVNFYVIWLLTFLP